MPDAEPGAGGLPQPTMGGGDLHARDDALFGRYELGRLLGCGAFAKVYHARDLRNGQSVAVKVILKKKIAASGQMAANVKREVSVMRRLSHPHIVRLFEVLATRSKIYFILEFLKGGELFGRVSRGRFSEDLSRRYFQQLVSAVAHCHAHGIFHRDLKPENLLLDDRGNLKVSDFGLSADGGAAGDPGLFHTLCGTPAYVAPEILAKKGYGGAKVDVWSCGVILFVLSAGFLPFNDPNLMVMYKKIYKGDYRCPRWISPDLKRFISRLLDTHPDTRITVDEILRDPWFLKGGGYDRLLRSHEADSGQDHAEKKTTPLNAFDIIAFSSGLDLSELFRESCNPVEDGERFLTEESPEKVLERIEGLGKGEGLRVMKREELGFHLEGPNGDSQLWIDVYRLTESQLVVEVRRRGDSAFLSEVWKNKIRAQLRGGEASQ